VSQSRGYFAWWPVVAALACVNGQNQTEFTFRIHLSATSLANVSELELVVNETALSVISVAVPNSSLVMTAGRVILMESSAPVLVHVSGQASDCVAGSTHWNGIDCLACTVCAQFTIQGCTVEADTVCGNECPTGTRVWQSMCTMCPRGTYGTGGIACSACADGLFANASGQSACQPCAPETTTSTQSGFSTCVKVGVGCI
jgi:hypothetical protein